MAGNPFDRTPLHSLERWTSQDFNTQGTQHDYALRYALQSLLAANSGFQPGFLGNGYRVVPNSPAGMSVLVSAGLGLASDPADVPTNIGGIVGLNDQASVKPLVLTAPQQFTVPANASGNPRIDIIEVRIDRRLENPSSRLVFDSGVGGFVPDTVDKTLAYTHDGRLGTVATPAASTAGLSYKTGTPAGSPVAPATTAGYTKIAEINVAAGAASITALHLVDTRRLLGPSGVHHASIRFRQQWNAGAPIVTVLGSVVPAGMQLAVITNPPVRAAGELIVVGGNVVGITAAGQFNGAAGAGNHFVSTVNCQTPFALTAPYQTDLDAAGIPLGLRQLVGSVLYSGQWTDLAVINSTNAALEDVTWNLQVGVSY